MSGSLLIDSSIVGTEAHSEPFKIGDLNPDKTFVHIFDDDSLNTLMSARDTISDFTEYLVKREQLIRGKRKVLTTGEEELLAIYLTKLNDDGEHDFVFPSPDDDMDEIFLPEGYWERFKSSPQRLEQIKADKISYLWDGLIERFSYYALRGEQYFVTEGGLQDSERILRFMAREPRHKRRNLGRVLMEMLESTPENKTRLRVGFPLEVGDPFYVFILFSRYTAEGIYIESDEDYRSVRRSYIEACCKIVKLKNPSAQDIVGIAMEPGLRRPTRSEDAVYLDGRMWDDNMQAEARELQSMLNILNTPRVIQRQVKEYPDIVSAPSSDKPKRNKLCPCGSGLKYKKCCLLK